ncbi:lipocalin family protein [Methylophaga frappieri]|nr:lipocalin family protein [Methylophaga frappieri]
MRSVQLIFSLFFLSGCSYHPDGIDPVSNFSVDAYLGKWYEVARLDHDFEAGLTQVTADYSYREDGGIRVINRGFNQAEERWEQAEGKAYFVDSPDIGHLKVSFFGPFYGAYVIFDLDSDYQYSYVAGPNRNYLWLLARTPDVSDAVKQNFLEQANTLGFTTSELIWLGTPPDQP